MIQDVADIIRSQVRSGDLIGRFGGDEFVVWLDLDEPDAASVVAERIRARVENLTVTVTTPNGPRSLTGLTVSIGAAPVTDTGTADHQPDLTSLLWAADEALYRAKHAGRNKVEIGHPLDPCNNGATVRYSEPVPDDGHR